MSTSLERAIGSTSGVIACARASSSTRRARGARSPRASATLAPTRVRVRPGKGIHVVFDRRLSNYGILAEGDRRPADLREPWQNVSVVGTTDDDYYGDLDDVVATSEEVRYLVQGVARVFPAIRAARAIGTYAGVRPTLYEYGQLEDALSREHAVVDHASDGAPGRLLDDRRQARELPPLRARDERSHRARSRAVVASARRTPRPLPGGERRVDALALAERARAHAGRGAAARLPARHRARSRPRAHVARGPTSATWSARASPSSRPRCATSSAPRWRAPSTTSRGARGSGSARAAGCAARRGAARSSRASSTFRRARAARRRSAFLVRQAEDARSRRSARSRRGKKRSRSRRCDRRG